jgi:hypothetical protein
MSTGATSPRQASKLEGPVFVVGPGRSGTTLMQSILSAHSRLTIAPETHFMSFVEDRGLEHGKPADFDAFWRELTGWVRFRDLGVSPDRCLAVLGDTRAPTFENIFRTLLAVYGESLGKKRVGEKTPGHSSFISFLYHWFPDARILAMIRDPRAVVASQLRTQYVQARLAPTGLRTGLVAGSRIHEIAHFARNWQVVVGERLRPWVDDPRLCVVQYESLVSKPTVTVREICAFLGEPYEPQMLSSRRSAALAAEAGNEPFDSWRTEHHRRSNEAVSAQSIDRWRSELSSLETALVEGLCGETMMRFGYLPQLPKRTRSLAAQLGRATLKVGHVESRVRGKDYTPYSKASATRPRVLPPGAREVHR